MSKRLLTAFFAVFLALILLYYTPTWAFVLAVCAVSVIAVYEFIISTGLLNNNGYGILMLSLSFSAFMPIWTYLGQHRRIADICMFIYISALFILWVLYYKKITIEKLGTVFLGTFFIPFFLTSLVRIFFSPDGKYLILLPLVIAWMSDAFALFGGKAFGKHKLAPSISPNKTVEGSVSGIFGSVIGVVIIGIILSVFFKKSPNYQILLLMGVFGSVVSQFGDLIFSAVKRNYNIKDYGNMFPGHGGMLDRFDSVLFAAPFIEAMILLLPKVL